MAKNRSAADAAATDRPGTWRELAVARSLDPARARAEERVQRFLDAAIELMQTDSGKDFTVQDVVERSGQSLRSFYQYFAGKHELLLALFEESVRSTAEYLEKVAAEEDEPLERLHRVAVEHFLVCRPAPSKTQRKSGGPTPAAIPPARCGRRPRRPPGGTRPRRAVPAAPRRRGRPPGRAGPMPGRGRTAPGPPRCAPAHPCRLQPPAGV